MTAAHYEPSHVPTARVEEVADGVFAYVQPDGGWCLNNSGFVAGRQVTVVDSCFTQRRTEALLAAVAEHAHAPVGSLVNTHHHADHTFGNAVFPPVTTIVAHELCRREVLKTGMFGGPFDGIERGQLTLAPPNLTFEDRLRMYVDGIEMELLFVGPAHTSNDIVVWLPAEKVVFCGDVVFNAVTPMFYFGSLRGSLRALDTIAALGPRVLVPGHGDVCGAEALAAQRRYFELVENAARSGLDAGLTAVDAARQTRLGEFEDWVDSERLAANLMRAMAELRGLSTEESFDLAAMEESMIALNGGKPLHCVA